MAGLGSSSATPVAQVTKQYIRIGNSDSTPNSYVEIVVKLARFWVGDYSSNAGQDYWIRNQRREDLGPIDEDGDGDTSDYNEWMENYERVRFKFIRKRDNGIKIEYEYKNNGNHIITIKYDGGKSNETYKKLKDKIEDKFNTSTVSWARKVPLRFEVSVVGNEDEKLPWKNNIDPGERHLAPKTLISLEEVTYVDDDGEAVEQPAGPGMASVQDIQGVEVDESKEESLDNMVVFSIDEEIGDERSFSDLQPEVCDKEEVVDEFGVPNIYESKVCPTCIPNLNFIPPDWTKQSGPWLNEKTCEYTVRVFVREPYESFLTFTTGKKKQERYVRAGIIQILNQYDKVVNDQEICARPPLSAEEECLPRIAQNIIDQYVEIYEVPTPAGDGTTFTVYGLNQEIYNNYDILNPIALELFARASEVSPARYIAPYIPDEQGNTYIKVTVPANLIDLLPIDELAAESEEQQLSLTQKTEVVLVGSKIKQMFKQVLPKAFSVYKDFQGMYKQMQNGRVRIDMDFDPNTSASKPFYINKYEKKFEEFYDDLKDLLENNKYKLYSNKNRDFTRRTKEALEVKIILSEENEENPFEILTIQARYRNCPFKKCGVGLKKFIEKYNKQPTLVSYVMSSNDMVSNIERSRTLPPWKDFLVQYTSPSIFFPSSNPEGDPDLESCLDNQEDVFNDLVLDLDFSFSRIVDYLFNSMNCRDFEKFNKQHYIFLMKGIQSGRIDSTLQAMYPEQYGAFGNVISDYVDLHDKTLGPDSKVAKFYSALINKKDEDIGFYERLTGKTIETAVTSLKGNSKEAVLEIFQKISPCNWEALTIDLLKCLLKGLNPIDGLLTAAKSLLNSQDPEQWEKIFFGLTPEQQAQIKNQIETQFGSLPTPWEFKKQQEEKGVVKLGDYEEQRNPAKNPDDPSILTTQESNAIFILIEEAEAEIKDLQRQQTDLNNRLNQLDELYTPIADINIKYGDQNAQDMLLNQSEYQGMWQTEGSQASVVDMMVDKIQVIFAAYDSGDFYEKKYFEVNGEQKLQILDSSGKQMDKSDNESINDVYFKYVNDLEAVIEITVDEIQKINNSITAKMAEKDQNVASAIQNIEEDRFAGDVNAYEKAIQETLKLLISAYTEQLLEALSIDEIRKVIDNIPGSEILGQYISTVLCPTQTQYSEFLDDLVGGIEFNPCMGKHGWRFPEIPRLPDFNWMEVLRYLLFKFLDYVIKRVLTALTNFLLRVLEKLLARVCDILSGIGVALLGDDDTTVLDAIADSFCSQDRFTPFANSLSEFGGQQRDSSVDTLRDLIKNYSDTTVSRTVVVEWVDAVSTNVNAKQWLKIFAEGADEDDFLIDEIWNATQETQFSQTVFPTKDDLIDFLNSISNSLPEDIQEDIENLIENLTISSDITFKDYCQQLTCDDSSSSYELESGYELDTLDPSVTISEDLEQVYEDFVKGPQVPIEEIITDISLNPGDPFCEDLLDEGDDMFDTAAASSIVSNAKPPELREFQQSLCNSVFSSLEVAYTNDMFGKKNSFFNSILADSDNVKLTKGSFIPHETREGSVVLAPNAANNYEEHSVRYDNANRLRRWWMNMFSDGTDENGRPYATNLFPETIGKWMATRTGAYYFLRDTNYSTKIRLKSRSKSISSKKEWKSLGFTSNNIKTFKKFVKKPDVSLSYTDRNDGNHFSWGFDLNYSNVALDIDDVGDAYYDTTNNPLYEMEIVEYTSTFPPSSAIGKFFAKFSSNSSNDTVTVNEELKTSLSVPIPYKNFENLYNTYKPANIRLKIDEDSTEFKRSHQEESFINFVKDDSTRRTLIEMGILQQDLGLKKRIPEASFTTAAGFVVNSPAGSLYEKIKNLICKNIISGIYNASKQGEVSNSYLFGYTSDSEINYADLLYVDPNANPDETYTWKYTHKEEDKVLGKSATENKRVVFLDPDIYGGTYKKPKIYIHPYPYKGWMGIMQAFVPEIDGCEPSKSGWLFLSEVSERVTTLENSLKKDVRLTYDRDCTRKPPYDLIADSSTHAYLDGIVTATIRTYIVELLLRCMPTLSNLQFNSSNFDTGMGIFLLDIMKNQMKDYPKNKRGGLIAKYRYWYLFLEQAVQTAERRILTNELTKDEQLTDLFDQIADVRKNYYYPTKKDRKMFKRVKKVSWNSSGFVDYMVYKEGPGSESYLSNGDPGFDKLSKFIDAVSFCAFGEDFREILKNLTEFKYKGHKISLKELRMYTKIYAIYQSEDIATEISSYLILNDFYSYQEKIKKYLPEKPYIQNLSKFVLNPKSGLTLGQPINVGTIDGEYADVIPLEEYGDVANVVDDKFNYHILDNINLSSQVSKLYGFFYLEKYVFITLKSDTQQEIKDLFEDYQGKPISVPAFNKVWTDFLLSATNEDEYYISEVFGNASKLNEDEYSGTIGIRFGVRLSYMPPVGFDPTSSDKTAEEVDDAMKNLQAKKEYYYKTLPAAFWEEPNYRYPIALLNYDQDVNDVKIKDFKFNKIDDNLKCYIDKLTEMKEYKYLMEYVFNIKSFATMSAIYSYYAFPDSVGEHELERKDPLRDNDKEWIGDIMKRTKQKCFALFRKHYKAQTIFRNLKDGRDKDSDSSKKYRELNIPKINKNLSIGIPWWQKARFHDRPFDEYGRECNDGALAAFDQLDKKDRPATDTNDYEYADQEVVSKVFGENATAVEASKEQQEQFLETNESGAYFMPPSYDETEEETTTFTQTTSVPATNTLATATEAYEEAQEEEPLFGEEDKAESSTVNQFSDVLNNL